MLLIATICGMMSGCVHRFRVAPPAAAPEVTVFSQRTHTSFGGLKEFPVKPDCNGNGLAEVITSRSFGQRFASVISFGFYDPVTIQWLCSKDSCAGAPPF